MDFGLHCSWGGRAPARRLIGARRGVLRVHRSRRTPRSAGARAAGTFPGGSVQDSAEAAAPPPRRSHTPATPTEGGAAAAAGRQETRFRRPPPPAFPRAGPRPRFGPWHSHLKRRLRRPGDRRSRRRGGDRTFRGQLAHAAPRRRAHAVFGGSGRADQGGPGRAPEGVSYSRGRPQEHPRRGKHGGHPGHRREGRPRPAHGPEDRGQGHVRHQRGRDDSSLRPARGEATDPGRDAGADRGPAASAHCQPAARAGGGDQEGSRRTPVLPGQQPRAPVKMLTNMRAEHRG